MILEPTSTAEESKPVRLGIMISGRGSTCLAIARQIREGRLTGCEIGVVVSNIPGAPGIEAARALGIPVVTLEGRGREQHDHEEAISALLRKFRIDIVCLAGYRRILSAGFVRQWKGRILTLHQSLLPAFPGRDAIQQALDSGVQFTGCTVTLVEEQVDGGVIVLQRVLEIYEGDKEPDVFHRLTPEGHLAYAEAIRRVISGQYEIHGKRYVRSDSIVMEPGLDVDDDTAVRPYDMPLHQQR